MVKYEEKIFFKHAPRAMWNYFFYRRNSLSMFSIVFKVLFFRTGFSDVKFYLLTVKRILWNARLSCALARVWQMVNFIAKYFLRSHIIIGSINYGIYTCYYKLLNRLKFCILVEIKFIFNILMGVLRRSRLLFANFQLIKLWISREHLLCSLKHLIIIYVER